MSKPEDIPQDVWDLAARFMERAYPYGAKEFAARTIMAAKAEEREAIIKECEAQKLAFLSPEYSSDQPLGSICERFAIDECIFAIRKRGEG